MDQDDVIRKELAILIKGGNAHMSFEEAVADFPLEKINTPVTNSNYLVWHMLEHMRITQSDILQFVIDPKHVSPEFPEGYWPKPEAKATAAQWKKIVHAIKSDSEAMVDLIHNRETDLFGPIPHATDYSIFREVLLAADHNAFHLSELVTLRRVLGLNPVKEY
ncbi:MAG TPA: DinB family protein [Syntrophorhabdaceae bacterium]|jgi:hypothetical protein